MYRIFAIFSVLALPILARADNWPGWRGPNHQGISQEEKLPLTWSQTENVRWKVPVQGAGVSTPIVWEDRIFLTASDGRLNDRLHLMCYQRDRGQLLWRTRLFGSAPTDLYPPGGMAVPTPCTDGERLYVLFGTGDLAAFDLDGTPVWIRSLAEEYGPFRNRWGMGTSPILHESTLYVQVDHWSQSYLLAIDPKTGVNRWKANRPTSVNWTSPLPWKVNGQTQIITFGTNHVRSHDARDGKELWRVDGMHFQCIPSPVAEGDLLVACSGDNSIGIKLKPGMGDLTNSHVLWKNKKAKAFVPSPLLQGGRLYIPEDKGVVGCYDARTGKEFWRERMGESYHASPVAGRGHIYFTSKEGVVRVIRASEGFELLSENDVGETLVASPALSNGRIYLRGEKHLYCIEEK